MGEAADIRSELLGLLEAQPPRDVELVQRLEASGPDVPVCSTLLHILTHLAFSEEEARRHWAAIRRHRERLETDLGRDVGLRVAILDYFQNVSRSLLSPKVIELRAYAETERSAISDGLTGLFNQTYFRQVLQREVQRARRHGRELSLVMLDLDDFKAINDTRGHVEGDRVLTRAADVIRSGLREIDLAARYGGEEFAVLLPDTPRAGGYAVAERIRTGIQKRFGRGRGAARVTLSGGVATCPTDARTPEDLVRRADSALYQAKASGKNRIVLVDANRRRHPRLPVRRRVTLSASSGRTATRTKDASPEGVLLSLHEPLPVGSQLRLTFDPEGEGRGVHGQVVRVAVAGHGIYDVGVRLDAES